MSAVSVEHASSGALRCAEWTAQAGVSLAGTASPSPMVVLVEWPLPWPRDASEIEQLAPLHAAIKQLNGRIQCIAPAGRVVENDGLREVAVLRAEQTTDGFTGSYVEQSARVPVDELVDTARSLVADPSAHRCERPHRRVLVCAHGRRDRCCGSMGTALALELLDIDLGDVAVWRTSHLGGHRFAPTALVLPEATQWGTLDAGIVRQIALRDGDPRQASAHYRGYTGFDSPAASVLDRYALAERGWEWLDQPRRAARTPHGWWRIEADDGTAWEGSVSVRRRVPVPACGEPIEAAAKSEAELTLDWAAAADGSA